MDDQKQQKNEQKIRQKYVVDVQWVKPATGMPAPTNKLLSLDDRWNFETVPFIAT